MINTRDYENAKRSLLYAYNLIAPSSWEQEKTVEVVWQMETRGDSYEKVLAAIAQTIVRGLLKGEW